MAKAFEPQILTANRLHEGGVVYWTGAEWVEDLHAAQVAHTPEEAEKLEALGLEEEVRCQVISPYIFAVKPLEDGTLDPISRREVIRAFGPSVPFIPGAVDARAGA
ncbi:MAG: DUF2849 domain-containing protein [Alphaproteobacteria bacterium]